MVETLIIIMKDGKGVSSEKNRLLNKFTYCEGNCDYQ
jgi:hypothetical protein